MSRKPWEIPISYNDAHVREVPEPDQRGDLPADDEPPRRHRANREVEVHGAVNDTAPMVYRSGDPEALFGPEDREDD